MARIYITGQLPPINVQGLPQGTKFCYIIPDTIYGAWMVVEHESFEELKDGDIIPDFGDIIINRIE